MNATAERRGIQDIALSLLDPSPNNPRKHYDPTALHELGQSLKEFQIEPIVVRLKPDGERFEILAGERRWRAADLAGMKTIEAKVVVCDDQRALEITVVENLQRENLSPLEEASGVASLVRAGWDAETIGAHLGKPPRWVALRSGLVRLTQAWTDAMATAGSGADRLTAGHLDLIARLTAEQQDDALHDIKDLAFDYDGHLFPVGDLRDELARRYAHDLSAAKWSLDDAELAPEAGACSNCPKRSSCQGALFADLVGTGKKKQDVCLDDTCWKSKESAWLKRQVRAAKEQHGADLLQIDPEAYRRSGKVLGSHDYEKAKPNQSGARPALIVGSSADAGKTVWVKPSASAIADVKLDPANEAAAARARLRTNRRAWMLKEINEACRSTKHPIKRPTDDGLVLRLAALSLNNKGHSREELKKAIAKQPMTKVMDQLWDAVVDDIAPSPHGAEYQTDGYVETMAELLGLDHGGLVAGAAAAHPDPKEGVTEPTTKKTKPAKKTKKGAA